MILYGKPVADALRKQYAEWIEAMAWKCTLTVIKNETSDKGYLAAIQREAERWKVNLMYAEDLKQAAQMQGVRVIDLRRNERGATYHLTKTGLEWLGRQLGIKITVR